MADEAEWQCQFQIPWQYEPRMKALVMVAEYLRFVTNATNMTFSIDEDSGSPTIVWVRANTRGVPTPHRINEVVLKVKRDIEGMLGNFIIPPKSVWDWVRENHFK